MPKSKLKDEKPKDKKKVTKDKNPHYTREQLLTLICPCGITRYHQHCVSCGTACSGSLCSAHSF